MSQIDKLVFAKLHRLGIERADVCSDSVFIRRVYLDVIGTLPTEQEAQQFIVSRDPDKRPALIDRLLAREEFATYWAMKWSDLLRVKAEFPINLWPNAAQTYHHWILASIRANKPYDKFVRELLTASGSNFRNAPVNFYRAMQDRGPEGVAQTVALTFMGARADKWPKARLAGMAGFFSQIGYKYTKEWKEEIVFFDPLKAAALATRPATQPAALPDGTAARLAAQTDPREVFADWLIDAKNPWFSKCIVNRVWFWLLGRGIVHEADDIRPDNPPSNPELLSYLEKEFVASGYDLKHMYRLILNSQTYQLASVPAAPRAGGAADAERDALAVANFARYPLRRLDAEVLMDAICQITGTSERYTSAIPEPFTFIPENQRSISLSDGSISSAFLELFGRASRDTGLDSDRNNRPTADQRLYMLNSSRIQNKIEQGPNLQPLLKVSGNGHQNVTSLYLTILSRFPTDQELRIVDEYSRTSSSKGRQAMVDLAWALINSAEFLYRH